jgi:hypothetical protein
MQKSPNKPYVGITGFMSQEEVSTIGNLYPPDSSGPLIMFGFLMSEKTLNGQPDKWPNRYPPRESLFKLFSRHPSGMNIIHYSSDNPNKLLLQLLSMVGLYWSGHPLAGDLDGFQLNIAWPSPAIIEEFRKFTNERKHFTVILQIGSKALQAVNNSPIELARRLKAYEDLADYILIDSSGGRGELVDIEKLRSYFWALDDFGITEKMGIGFAGGLCFKTLPFVRPTFGEFEHPSMDAERRLRDANDRMDLRETSFYLAEALSMYGVVNIKYPRKNK